MPTKIFKALESLSIKTTSVKTATKKQEQKDLYSLKVLIAEDNPINQKLLQTTLKGLGIESDIANNGLEAFNKYTMNPDKYDVIFMDVQMPVMDGVEATHEILEYEEEEEIPHTPIIAVTANVLKGDREKFLGAGMDEYISKPISRDALLKILERVAQGEFSKEYNEPVKQTPQQEQTEKIPEQTNQQIQKESKKILITTSEFLANYIKALINGIIIVKSIEELTKALVEYENAMIIIDENFTQKETKFLIKSLKKLEPKKIILLGDSEVEGADVVLHDIKPQTIQNEINKG